MEPRRIVLALLLAGALTALAAYFYIQYGHRDQGTKTTKLVAATQSLNAGVVLRKEDLILVDWPGNLVLEGSFSKMDEVVGRSIIYPVQEKELILKRGLADPGSGIGLTVKIPQGMRAVAIHSNEIVGVAGFLFPGSRVDVLGTFHPPGETSPLAQTILQDVEVLTAGQRIQPDPQGKPETVNVVTLLLTPEDSEKIILATSLGSIQFVLRSGADKGKETTRAVTMAALIGGAEKPPTPAGERTVPHGRIRATKLSAAAPPKPPDFYTVEVIQGEKRSVEKFE